MGVLADFGFTECHALSSEVDLHVTDTDLQEPRERSMDDEKTIVLVCE